MAAVPEDKQPYTTAPATSIPSHDVSDEISLQKGELLGQESTNPVLNAKMVCTPMDGSGVRMLEHPVHIQSRTLGHRHADTLRRCLQFSYGCSTAAREECALPLCS